MSQEIESLINYNHCMSIKSKKQPYIQCPHQKKVGDYCGIHAKSNNVSRFDHLIASIKIVPVEQITSTPPENATMSLASTPTMDHESSPDINTIETPNKTTNKTTSKTGKPSLKSKFSHLKGKISIKKQHLYQYAEFRDLTYDQISSSALSHSLKRYGLANIGSLDEKVARLREYLADQHQSELITSMGPARDDRSLCNNESDCYEFTQLEQVPDCYFFSFECRDNKVYGCDVRSLYRYLTMLKSDEQKDYPNPYNRQKLSEYTLDQYQQKLDFLKKYNYSLELIDSWEFTPQQKLRNKVLQVFQSMYHEGYPVNHQWFMDLSRLKLIEFYEKLEDIWNYRLELSNNQKKQIIGDYVSIFNKSELKNLITKTELQIRWLLIDKIDAMATKGETKDDRLTGMMAVLSGLVEICPSAAESLPALAYGAGMGAN